MCQLLEFVVVDPVDDDVRDILVGRHQAVGQDSVVVQQLVALSPLVGKQLHIRSEGLGTFGLDFFPFGVTMEVTS